MVGYGDEDEVCRQLGIDPDDLADAGAVARVAALNQSLSRIFDARCNRTGEAEETRTVQATGWDGHAIDWWTSGYAGECTLLLVLPSPVLAITSVFEGGTWDGLVWDEEDEVLATDYRLTHGSTARGYHAIERTGGWGWAGPVRIAGTWADAGWAADAVPPEVEDALTYLVVTHYREDLMSPAGVVGPEGELVPSRNPWTMGRVLSAINEYRVKELVV